MAIDLNIDEYGFYSVYELSQATGKNYRTLKKILEALQEKNQIATNVRTGVNGKEVVLYDINQDTINSLNLYFDSLKSDKDILLARTSAHIQEATSDNIPSIDDYKKIIKEAINARDTIVNLNGKITELKNYNVRLESDLKVANSEIKLISERKNTVEAEHARLQQELNTSNITKAELERGIKRRNIAILVLSTLILIALTISGTILLIR